MIILKQQILYKQENIQINCIKMSCGSAKEEWNTVVAESCWGSKSFRWNPDNKEGFSPESHVQMKNDGTRRKKFDSEEMDCTDLSSWMKTVNIPNKVFQDVAHPAADHVLNFLISWTGWVSRWHAECFEMIYHRATFLKLCLNTRFL